MTGQEPKGRVERLEGRVTGLERDVQYARQLAEQTNHTVQDGFVEMRRTLESYAERSQRQMNDLHARVTETNERLLQRDQVNWTLVVSIIVAAVAVGGVGVAFVHMSMVPVTRDIQYIYSQLREHVDTDGHTEMLMFKASTTTALDSMRDELAQMRGSIQSLQEQKLQNTAHIGQLNTSIAHLSDLMRYQTVSENGRRNMAELQTLEQRLRVIELWLQSQSGP